MNISTNRVESFSDCVISIIITIMVFNLFSSPLKGKLTDFAEQRLLVKLLPGLISYFFSFLILGIMWINHHHMFHLMQKVDEKLLWLNLHLLFWMSLVPFPTSMLSSNPTLSESAAIYGIVLFMSSFAFTLMRRYAMKKGLMHIDEEPKLNKTVDKVSKRARTKNYIAMSAYLISIPLAYVSVYISFACFLVSPILFFIPDGIDDEVLAEKIADGNIAANLSPSSDETTDTV